MKFTSAPKVSICIPTYNGEEYLQECLNCIRIQNFNDFEVIIVDDESTDKSFEIASAYESKDPRFKVYRNKQRLGLVGNWNRCLELSRGTWIKLLFQDDLIAGSCLERLVACCEHYQQPFGFCHREVIFDDYTSVPVRDYFGKHQQLLKKLYGPKDSYVDSVTFARMVVDRPDWNLIGEPTVTLFNRSVITKLGKFDPGLIQNCDMEYWARLGTNLGVVHVAECLATFRVHGKSTTSHNLTKREFHAKFIDPLVNHYLLLRRQHYQTLRKELYASSGRFVNWWRLIWSSHYAWRMARPALFNPALGDTGIKNEWKTVIKNYPELKSFAILGLFIMPIRHLITLLRLDRHVKKDVKIVN